MVYCQLEFGCRHGGWLCGCSGRYNCTAGAKAGGGVGGVKSEIQDAKVKAEKAAALWGSLVFPEERRRDPTVVEGVCGGPGFWVTHYDAVANMTTNEASRFLTEAQKYRDLCTCAGKKLHYSTTGQRVCEDRSYICLQVFQD